MERETVPFPSMFQAAERLTGVHTGRRCRSLALNLHRLGKAQRLPEVMTHILLLAHAQVLTKCGNFLCLTIAKRS